MSDPQQPADDNSIVALPCPNCGKDVDVDLLDVIHNGTEIFCPHCNEPLELIVDPESGIELP